MHSTLPEEKILDTKDVKHKTTNVQNFGLFHRREGSRENRENRNLSIFCKKDKW